MIDYATITELIYQRLRSHAAGASVRAALGDASNSVVLAADIRRSEQQSTVQLPAVPFLALRYGPAGSGDQVVWQPVYTWFCYDSPAIGYGRLLTLPALIASAYRPELALVAGEDTIEISMAAPSPDMVLGLLVLPVVVAISAI